MCIRKDDVETALTLEGRRKKAVKILRISKLGSTYASCSLCILYQYT